MNINDLYDLLDRIPVTGKNKEEIEDVKRALEAQNYTLAMSMIKRLYANTPKRKNDEEKDETEEKDKNQEEVIIKTRERRKQVEKKEEEEDFERKYPKALSNPDLEKSYIGNLLKSPEEIVKYYFIFDDCYFEDDRVLNLYKRVLFTDGEKYAPEIAKRGYNFSKASETSYKIESIFTKYVENKTYDMEKLYIELRKLFALRKAYTAVPIKNVQDKIIEITSYKLYSKMSIEEVESAIEQVNATEKFRRAILTENLTKFLEEGDNNLTNGLALPFPILSSVFKGIRKGETMAFAMPSNAGKSRFTINLAAYVALIHKKKVLIISNEMSEEKLRLCLITTILNNQEIQKIHGQKLHKTEGEILEFKFRPDKGVKAELDENGFILRKEKESKKDFIKRLTEISSEFNRTITATNWANEQLNNSVYFINITDHTNDELRKVIMNYYYKEQIEYIFYDTLKTDTANIGNGEELKKTATILSNLAQNFNLFIGSTLQLAETSTLPVNLNINDLAVSRTVKEVLDTLCLIKQISNTTLEKYEYSLKEVDKEFFELKKYEDPDVRYYACVVDKNRAGAKPKVLFRLNLAYNYWEELGYVKLKQENEM
ncbi:MAG: DnaB-like helicase C-terminal domain-containing protein [Clostridia bacterium]